MHEVRPSDEPDFWHTFPRHTQAAETLNQLFWSQLKRVGVSGLRRRLAIRRHALNMLSTRKSHLRQPLKRTAMPPIINAGWLSVHTTRRCRQKLRKNLTIISSFASGRHRPRSVGCSPPITAQSQKSICSLILTSMHSVITGARQGASDDLLRDALRT